MSLEWRPPLEASCRSPWIFLRRSNGDDNRLLPEGEAAALLLGEPEASRGVDVRSTRSCLGDGITATAWLHRATFVRRAGRQLRASRRPGDRAREGKRAMQESLPNFPLYP